MQERRSISPFQPLLLSLALVAGLFIGRDMSGPPSKGGPMMVFGSRQTSASEKIGQVIDLIDRQYVDTVQKQALVDEVLQDILQRLDPHSYYISAAEIRAAQEPLEGSFEGIGVEFAIQRDTIVVISPVEGGPSAAVGIRAGDRILAANGIPLAGVNITNEDVIKNLRGPENSEVKVDIQRVGQDKPFEVAINRGRIPINSVAVSLLGEDKTGYVKLIRFAKNTHAEFMQAVEGLQKQGMKRLVLDLRGNGGGYLTSAVELADEFLPDGNVIVFTQGRNSPRRDITATANGSLHEIPLAILIDEGSASASEIIAGAVQDNDRGIVVGRRSFGKGLVQEHVDLPDHSAVRLTTARYYTPSGRSIQRPYGEGVDYNDDIETRYEHGEMLSVDSIKLDSSQVYRTTRGRAVYGGGGIMPDVFVPADTTEISGYLTELFFSGAINQFAFDVADRDRSKLLDHGTFKEFATKFQITDQLLNELQRFAGTQGVPERPEELSRSKSQIATRLKAGIARNLWGNAGYYEIILDSDQIYLKASEELGEGA
ncbi:MAG: S41 family peptidase [Bacteroidota bacterium]|nr:S41 family peptidase [Bacteroidota bacterium]